MSASRGRAASALHAGEVRIDPHLPRRLVARQFPEWRDLPIRRVPSNGTDNAIFRLGDDLGIRMPRIGWAAPQVQRESDLLPVLGPLLDVEVPMSVAVGEPAHGYPFSWLVYRWLEGEDLDHVVPADWLEVAQDLARFITVLERVDPAEAPRGGRHGGRMRADDTSVRKCIEGLREAIDADRALAIWDVALEAEDWGAPPVWVHGDLLPGNVLMREGRVSGVIDWASAGIGDPACELMIAWSLPVDARAVFRSSFDFDDATWSRARGWVVEQAVHFIPYYERTIPGGVASALRRLRALLEEDPADGA